jgi:hypothetical protein
MDLERDVFLPFLSGGLALMEKSIFINILSIFSAQNLNLNP